MGVADNEAWPGRPDGKPALDPDRPVCLASAREQTRSVIGSDQTPGGGPEGTPPSAASVPTATPEVPASSLDPQAAAPAAGRRPGALRRTWEWFWRGRAMAELRNAGTAGSARGAELLRRGWLSLEVAQRTLDPPERFMSGPPDTVAWELSRQAVYWGLRADRLLETGSDDGAVTLSELLRGARARLVAAAGSESELAALETALSSRTLAEQSELSAEEQSRSAHAMSRFARAVLIDLERPRVRVDRLWFQRLWRCGGLLVLLALLVIGAFMARNLMWRDRDVAYGKPWRASSTLTATTSCASPLQECPESPFFFFHTLDEERPWLEIDLGSKQRIVGAIIENRQDCCADRTVPMVISVSTDHKSWKEVVRRTEIFGTWSPTFAPVSARWVRVQVLKRASLHLHRASFLRE
jgi:hypothetical protein